MQYNTFSTILKTLQESGGKYFILLKATLRKGWQVMHSRPPNKAEASIKVIASSSGYYSMLMFPNENSKSQPKRSMKTQRTALAPGQTSQRVFCLDIGRNCRKSRVGSDAFLAEPSHFCRLSRYNSKNLHHLFAV